MCVPETSLPPSKGVKNKGGCQSGQGRRDGRGQPPPHEPCRCHLLSPSTQLVRGPGGVGVPRHRRDQAPFPGRLSHLRAPGLPLCPPGRSRPLPAPGAACRARSPRPASPLSHTALRRTASPKASGCPKGQSHLFYPFSLKPVRRGDSQSIRPSVRPSG